MQETIEKWRNSSDKILIIFGKRGVGKTLLAKKIFEDMGIVPEVVAHVKDIDKWLDWQAGLLVDNASKRTLSDVTLPLLSNDTMTFRSLGSNKMRIVKTPKIIVTTNETALSQDLERRCFRIKLPATETVE